MSSLHRKKGYTFPVSHRLWTDGLKITTKEKGEKVILFQLVQVISCNLFIYVSVFGLIEVGVCELRFANRILNEIEH